MALPLAQVPIAPSIATPIPVPQAPPATPIPVPPVNAGFDPDAYLKEVATTAVKPEADAFDPDSYVADEAKKYVEDDDFDPLTLAYEQPDKKEFAKEIEFRKSQRPMTGARAGKAVKNFGKAIPGIVEDFGKGFGNIIADSYIQATDDNPANVERAKTQQLARAQLIESHGSGFLNKLFGPDSWIGSHVARSPESIVKTAPMEREQIQKMYGHAKPGSEIDQIRVAELARVDKEEAEAQAKIAHGPETPRQKSDRMFEEKLAQIHKEREILKGVPQPDGIVAELTKGAGQATHRLITGEAAPEDMYHVEDTFKTGAQLAAMNAPIDEEAIRTGAVTADPINLAPLNLPKMVPLANKVGGALLKAPAYLTSKVVENTPEVISAAAKKRILGAGATAAGGAVAYEALKDPAAAAKHLLIAGAVTTGVAGAKYFGRVMDVAGSKMLNPKFVSAAEKAAAESAMNIEKAGGSKVSKFFDPAMNKADIERAIVRPLQGAVSAPIAMAPLNAAISENPEEFAALSGTATGFGLFGGATAYNPIKGFHPETVAAVDSLLRDQGAKKKYGTPLDAQHEAFMEKAPEGVRDAVNSYRGFFDGFKLSSRREPQIYVLPSAEFGAEVSKRRPDVTPDHAAKQRGFIGKDGAILINGDYGGEAPGILGHEAGGHAAMSIMEVLLPEISKSMEAAARTGLTDGKGNPTPQMRKFVEAYNKEFDPTGKRKEIKTETQAINEWLAEQARAVLDGQGPAKYAAGNSVRQKIADNLGDHFQKVFGTKRAFDRSEVPAVARQYRDLLFQLGRLRGQEGPETAPEPAPGEPAAAPASEPAAPAPAGARPAAEPAAPMPGDRATVAAALRSLFGVKQAEADAMAAAATGSTVEEMIASAAQAKSKAVAGSRTTAPAAQPAPLQPAGQLAGVETAAAPSGAPAGQLAGFGEPAPAPAAKPKMRVTKQPDGRFEYRDESGNLIPTDAKGQPVRPGTAPEAPDSSRGGAATPLELPGRPVDAPADLQARVQAAEDAARADEATKKRRTPASREKATAQAVKAARIQALLDAAHESAPDEAHLQRREDFGTVKYTGRIDESIPAHRMLLDELGISEGARSNIDTLSENLGKPVFIKYKSAAKEGSSEAAQASGNVDRTGKQRAKEYKAESVGARIEDAQAGDVNTGVEQTKSFYPLGFRVNPSTGSVTVTGFSPQRLLLNVGKIVEFMRGKGRETGYTGADDPAINDDMQGYAQNHANGYKGDGSGPIAGETPAPNYEPYIIDGTRFDVLNAAMGNESAKTPKSDREGAKARAGDLQDFAAANDTLLNEGGETNALRQWLNESGFEFRNESGETRTGTKEVLEPTIESLRVDPELMREISTEAPEGEASLRPTGVADPSGMTAAGIPKARNVAAGFMPGQGAEKGQLSEFGGDREQPSIKSKVEDSPEFKRWFGKSKIVDADGDPKVVYHGGDFDPTDTSTPAIFTSKAEGIHFGTKASAEERVGGSGVVDNLIKGIKVTEGEDGWHYDIDGQEGNYDWEEGGFATREQAQSAAEREAVEMADYADAPEANFTAAFLKIENPIRVPDMGTWGVGDMLRRLRGDKILTPEESDAIGELTRSGKMGDDWAALKAKLKEKGYDGFVYKNQVEDKGNDSYIVFDSNQVKSADLNNGEFNAENPDIRFMPGQGKQLEGFDRNPKTDELGFYSRLRQHVDEADFGTSKPKAAQHWLGVIEKWAKGASTPTLGVQSRGIARDELEWSGVKEWLKSQGSKPIKKADVLDFIEKNGVQVKEVTKSAGEGKGGDAYFMDDEVQDNGDTGGDGGGLWTIDAWPNEEFFGEDRNSMDPKLMAFISMKPAPKHKVIPLKNGKFKAYHGDESLGEFDSKEEAHEALVEEYGEPVEGETEYEVWDGPSNSHHETFSSIEEAEQAAKELARDNLQRLNEEHAEDGEGAGDTQFSGYKLKGGSNYKEIELILGETGKSRDGKFKESHWPEDDVVAHFRQQDFDGQIQIGSGDDKTLTSEKVRHIDEFQSDWHQKGRERGYKDGTERNPVEIRDELVALERQYEEASKGIPSKVWEVYNEQVDSPDATHPDIIVANKIRAELNPLIEAKKAELYAATGNKKLPDAPFKKTWSQLAFKRALKLAVEDGMDRMSWSTGDQNIEHYKHALVAAVDRVDWQGSSRLDKDLAAIGETVVTLKLHNSDAMKLFVDKSGQIARAGGHRIANSFVGKELGEVIGADNAKRIMQEPKGSMDGGGMQVGGEGMRTFYDEMIPQFAKKYVEKWGSKVEDIVLPNGETVHSVEITPEMRAAVEQGQPMFMPGKGTDKPAGDLSDFGGKDESSIESKVEWAQPKRAKAAGDVVVNVKTSAFDEAFQKDHGFYIDKDGNGEIKGRRDRFKEFLKEGKAIEMPEVVITKEGTAAFVNGRHRFSVMRDAGVESVPMSMDETSALRAQTLGMTVEGKSEGGDLGGFMPSDATGRGEFEVKEKKPVDERRVRLMADMQNQAKWLTAQAKELGFDSPDDLAAEDFDAFNRLAKQWREEHPRFDDAGKQLFMPGDEKNGFPVFSPDAPADVETDKGGIVGEGYHFMPSAYHGTPHEFDKFSIGKMGSGEGAQAFGWGLYFAENQKVAEEYRKRLSDYNAPGEFYYKGEIFKSTDYDSPDRHAISLAFHQGKKTAVQIAKQGLADAKKGEPYAMEAGGEAYYNRMLQVANDISSVKQIKFKQGHTYKVDLDVSDSELVHYDKPLSEQPKPVQDIIRDILKKGKYLRPGEDGPRQLSGAWKSWLTENGGMSSKDSGESVYDAITKDQGGDEKAASMFLDGKGVHGIKYADEGSRNKRSGKTFNYVIFNDSKITVSDRNGRPVNLHDAAPGQASESGDFMPGQGEDKGLHVYHGTPHKIVGPFDLSKVGTGEGSQAYGHGLYFAEHKDVALSYWPRESGMEDKLLQKYKAAEGRENYDEMELWEAAMLHELPDSIRDKYDHVDEKTRDRVAKELGKILQSAKGGIYKVRMDVKPEELLDWDKPLSEQPEGVQKSLRKALESDGWKNFLQAVDSYDAGDKRAVRDAGYNIFDYPGAAGGIYQTIAGELGPRKASALLAKFGIPGIKFLDEGSRDQGRTDKTSNYVVFDTSRLKIVGRNGKLESPAPGDMFNPGEGPRRTWFVRGGRRVYHNRGDGGMFSEKPALAKPGVSATSQDDEDEKAQLKAFK